MKRRRRVRQILSFFLSIFTDKKTLDYAISQIASRRGEVNADLFKPFQNLKFQNLNLEIPPKFYINKLNRHLLFINRKYGSLPCKSVLGCSFAESIILIERPLHIDSETYDIVIDLITMLLLLLLLIDWLSSPNHFHIVASHSTNLLIKFWFSFHGCFLWWISEMTKHIFINNSIIIDIALQLVQSYKPLSSDVYWGHLGDFWYFILNSKNWEICSFV